MNLLKLIRKLKTSLERNRYDPTTISEYLRKRGAQVGDDCYIVPTDLGTEPYLVKIGNHVAIASGVQFITHDGGVHVFRREVPDLQVFGPIIIEDNCMIGQNAILLPNVRIGRNSVVGAGSVVISDIPPNSIVMGVPARPFGTMDVFRERSLQRWSEQRPPDAIDEPGKRWTEQQSQHFEENRTRLRRHLLEIFKDRMA